MKKRQWIIALGLSACLLMGLAPMWPGLTATVITNVDFRTLYSRSLVRMAIGSEGLPAEIYGAPNAGVTADQIAERLRLPAVFQKREIHAITAEERERYPNRLVLLFNAGVTDVRYVCNTPETLGAEAKDGDLQVMAVLCFKDDYYAQGDMRQRGLKGLEDERFTKSMTSLFRAIMPLRNPEKEGGKFNSF